MRYTIPLLVLASFSFAEPLSLGLGLGILNPVSSPSYKEQSKAFVNPSILLGIQFAEFSALTFEFDFTAPNGGVGGWVGLEQQFIERQITPFAEAQVGARNPGREKRGYNFNETFGFAYSLNGGVIFFRESQFRIRLKGGYEMIVNNDYDQSWNAEVGVLFAIGKAGLETINVN